MTEPRLAAEMLVHSLLRTVNQEGGFGMVIRKGDPVSGSILIQCLEKGRNPKLLERMPTLDSGTLWQQIWPQATDKKEKLSQYLERRYKYDPDLWVVELDIPDAERLIAQIGQ